VDFFGKLLRQLAQHLTAYDLATFHHGGANYPDALFLDVILKDHFLGEIDMIGEADADEETRALFLADDPPSRLRRRGLRQGCLLRRRYEFHPVPDMPTSPGENARVLPAPYRRVPDEQLAHAHRRRRRLFKTIPVTRYFDRPTLFEAFRRSIEDLQNPAERTELGVGLFIDRPLGYGKAVGEPDLTPMLAHQAFSLSIARRRVQELKQFAEELSLELPGDHFEAVAHELDRDAVRGVPAALLAEPGRPTAALTDVRRVAPDFMIVRTMPGGLGEFLSYFDWTPRRAVADLPFLRENRRPRVVAVVQTPRGPVLGFFDDDYRCRLEATVDASAGFVRRAGIELPTKGLRIVAIDDRDVSGQDVWVPRRD
jgi:hypothetical protein